MGNKESGEIKFDQWKEYLYIYIFFVLTKRERFPFHSRILKEGEEEASSTNDGEKRLIAVTIQYILVINFICMENGSRVEFSFETDGNRHPCVIPSPPPHKIIKHPAWRKAHVPHAFIRSLAKHPTPFCAINNTQTILLFPSRGSKKKFRHPITRHRPPSRLISKRRRTDTMRGKEEGVTWTNIIYFILVFLSTRGQFLSRILSQLVLAEADTTTRESGVSVETIGNWESTG